VIFSNLCVRVKYDFGGHLGGEGIEAGTRHTRRLFELEAAHLDDGEEIGRFGTDNQCLSRVVFRVAGVD
jgi:hypothetical protein